ncbi:unnamed protein product [Paramecium sonneborni]|uniref:Uncharacterized protein n=1 Tax=Paramecium sonneborni TaxID=65129 RepID=A0A8S1R971_9CILI|nr:unnamed protein product [Paramecium sonneborni]
MRKSEKVFAEEKKQDIQSAGNIQGAENQVDQSQLKQNIESARKRLEQLSPIEFLIEIIKGENQNDVQCIIEKYMERYWQANPDSRIFSLDQFLCLPNWKCFKKILNIITSFEVKGFKKSFQIKDDFQICRFYGSVYFQNNDNNSIQYEMINLKILKILPDILDNKEVFLQIQVIAFSKDNEYNKQQIIKKILKIENIEKILRKYDPQKNNLENNFLNWLIYFIQYVDFESLKNFVEKNKKLIEQNDYNYDIWRGQSCEYGFQTTQEELYIGQFFLNKYHGNGRLWQDFSQKNKKISEQFFDGKKIEEKFKFAKQNENIIDLGINQNVQIIPKDVDNQQKGEFVKRVKDKYQYAGQFLNSKFDGCGIMNFENGNQYKGQWKDGLMDGMGQFIWVNGEEYIGQYVKGKKHGFGKYQYLNKIYLGFFRDGFQDGIGLFKKGNGQYFETEWYNGKLDI